jgi:serine/threonine protein kinase
MKSRNFTDYQMVDLWDKLHLLHKDVDTHPTNIFNLEIRRLIEFHMTFEKKRSQLKAGVYELTDLANKSGIIPSFKIDHDMIKIGRVDFTNIQKEQQDVAKCLLHPAYEGRFFQAGAHVLPSYDQHGRVHHYYFVEIPKDMIVRKDKYGNMVCDIINTNHLLGKGSFASVYTYDGSLKYRFFDEPGVKFEPNAGRRVIRLEDNISKSSINVYQAKMRAGNELAQVCTHLGVRPVFFGVRNRKIVCGTSMHKITGENLLDVIARDWAGTEVLSLEDRFQLSIALFKQLKLQFHDLDLVHRDIKPENILVYKDAQGWHVNIIDVNLSRYKNKKDKLSCGTACYAAPEVYQGKDNQFSDIFSMALVVGMIWRDLAQIKICKRGYGPAGCGFDLFEGITADVPHTCQTDILNILKHAINSMKKARPAAATCQNEFERIYLDFRQNVAMPEDRQNIEQGFYLADTTKSIQACYAATPVTKEDALRLQDYLTRCVKQLPRHAVAIREFVSSLGFQCLSGMGSAEDFVDEMQHIIDNFFAAHADILVIRAEMLGQLERFALLQYPDETSATALASHIEQLDVFAKNILNTPIDFDKLVAETTHMHRKFSKMVSEYVCFNNLLKMGEERAGLRISK